VITVISQNTADANTRRAFENLRKKFPITPKALARARVEEIEDCLRTAGLYRNKSKVIRNISRIVNQRFDGSLDFVYFMPMDEARKTLMEFPGVGPKTADVVLLFCASKPTVPVDTHVFRVSKKLGFADANTDYEGIRMSLQTLFSPEDYLAVHLLLISLGRKYCKARNTLCWTCPVANFCPSRKKSSNGE
jgi:endonuclease-3